jgi:hypothetical protein
VKLASWPVNAIDRFILARLEAERLRPARPATREQLIRRVSFDLIGLPPSPAEVEAFVKDRSAAAWTNLVERLLASPHYGERWARHWLDVVRYAESDGFEHDAIRPNAWRYRDYVIQSFNADKPCDRFIQEQIAGDELWPGDPQAVIATAFNLLGPDMVDSSDQVQRRLLTLSDMTDTTASAFLGLTMGCARCHDHKLEPFSQVDYYSLQSFFAPAQFHRDLPVPTEEEQARHKSAMADYRSRTSSIQQELDQLERPYRDRLYAEKLSKLSEDVQLAHRTPSEQRTAEQQASVLETAPQLQITDAEVVKLLAAEDKARRKKIEDVLKKIPKPAPLPVTLALQNTNGPAPVTRVLRRGDYNNPADTVKPAFPVALRLGASREQPARSAVDDGRRSMLARWLTEPGNPLTARVMVNRIWQHHFGRGLVTTPSDFGTQGARPTHPELLDWLAAQFMAEGWSIKKLHRLILYSATYQQSSEPSSATATADPENRWFSRQNRVRLEGEILRDSLLFISGRLNESQGGPSVFPPIAADIVSTSKNWAASKDPADHHRRSIYIFARRNLRFPFLEVFDAPDSNLSCAMRGQSTTAPQSLTLLNSSEVMQAATATAQRLTELNERGDESRIAMAFRLILGRNPGRAELRASHDFVSRTRERSSAFSSAKPTAPPAEWVELCRALFNLNDFVYVD